MPTITEIISVRSTGTEVNVLVELDCGDVINMEYEADCIFSLKTNESFELECPFCLKENATTQKTTPLETGGKAD